MTSESRRCIQHDVSLRVPSLPRCMRFAMRARSPRAPPRPSHTMLF